MRNHEETVEEREFRLRMETAYNAGRDAERKRAVAYLREQGSANSGYYAKGTDWSLKVEAVVRRLATDLERGEHRTPTRENNPELWR